MRYNLTQASPAVAQDPFSGGATTIILEVARKLGGKKVLNANVRSMGDLTHAVQQRIDLEALSHTERAGIHQQEIFDLIIADRTLRHRRSRGEPLTVEESDRLVRILRIQSLAETTFGDVDKAGKWLRQPLRLLGGKAPLKVAQTEAGARLIESILAKIAWGAAA